MRKGLGDHGVPLGLLFFGDLGADGEAGQHHREYPGEHFPLHLQFGGEIVEGLLVTGLYRPLHLLTRRRYREGQERPGEEKPHIFVFVPVAGQRLKENPIRQGASKGPVEDDAGRRRLILEHPRGGVVRCPLEPTAGERPNIRYVGVERYPLAATGRAPSRARSSLARRRRARARAPSSSKAVEEPRFTGRRLPVARGGLELGDGRRGSGGGGRGNVLGGRALDGRRRGFDGHRNAMQPEAVRRKMERP